MSKRERKAPEKLVYDVPEPKAKKPKAAKKVAGTKKEKKAKKGYKGAMGAYMFFVQENRSEVTTSFISSCFLLYSFGVRSPPTIQMHHSERCDCSTCTRSQRLTTCADCADWQASGCRMAGMLSEGQEEVRGHGRQGQDPCCKRQGRLGEVAFCLIDQCSLLNHPVATVRYHTVRTRTSRTERSECGTPNN